MNISEVMTAEGIFSHTTVIYRWVAPIVHGVIFGIQYALCGNRHIDNIVDGMTGDTLLSFECTDSQYEKFKELVQELYPDACVFNVGYGKFGWEVL